MVERNFLVKRKGKTLNRSYTREQAKTKKKLLQKAGVKYMSIVKVK